MKVCIHREWFSFCTVEHRPRWLASGRKRRFFLRFGSLCGWHKVVSL